MTFKIWPVKNNDPIYLRHYSRIRKLSPPDFIVDGEYVRFAEQIENFKPKGFCFTVEGFDGDMTWAKWCLIEKFNVNHLKWYCDITLRPEAKILWLDRKSDIDNFTKMYGRHLGSYSVGIAHHINWPLVAQDYQGIIIAPYQWNCRLQQNCPWYYPWDCSAGYIWDVDAIESVSKRMRTDLEKYKPRISEV